MAGNHLTRAAVAGLLLMAGCTPFSNFVHDEILIGPYRLVAVDGEEDMALCWSISDGSCLGDGLPGPTVFAAGYDSRYLVAAVHPSEFPQAPDRSITHYYYVIRSSDENQRLPYSGIKGPFNEAAYNAEKTRLRLPEFTRVFDNLR